MIRGSQIARYATYIYALIDNDFRPNPGIQTPLHLWSLGDVGTLDVNQYKKVSSAVSSILTSHEVDDQYLLNIGEALDGDIKGIALEKYGANPLPAVFVNRLFRFPPIDGLDVGGLTQFGVVFWTDPANPPFELVTVNPQMFDYQPGIGVPADIGGAAAAAAAAGGDQAIAAALPVNNNNLGGGGRRSRNHSRSRKHHSKKRHTRRRHH